MRSSTTGPEGEIFPPASRVKDSSSAAPCLTVSCNTRLRNQPRPIQVQNYVLVTDLLFLSLKGGPVIFRCRCLSLPSVVTTFVPKRLNATYCSTGFGKSLHLCVT